jgi:hypothetical protein
VEQQLSKIVKNMADSIVVNKNASPQAISVALQIAHIAWNFVHEEYEEEPGYIHGIVETQESMRSVKSDFITQDAADLIARLMKYKLRHHPNDKRGIFACEYEKGKVKATWR